MESMDYAPPTDAALEGVTSAWSMLGHGETVFLSSGAPEEPEAFATWLQEAQFQGHVSATGEVSAAVVGRRGQDPEKLVDISERVYEYARESP